MGDTATCHPSKRRHTKSGQCQSCYSKKKYKTKDWREIHYRRAYGLSVTQVEEILVRQGHRCAVCGKSVSLGKFKMHLDHSHTTGKVRGILCLTCNGNLEWFIVNRHSVERYLMHDGGTLAELANGDDDARLLEVTGVALGGGYEGCSVPSLHLPAMGRTHP